MSTAGTDKKGFTKAVLYRGTIYRSLEAASIQGNRLEPSTRSPADSRRSSSASPVTAKLRDLSLPSPPTCRKFSISMLLIMMNLMMSCLVKSSAGFTRNWTSLFMFIATVSFIAWLLLFRCRPSCLTAREAGPWSR